MGDKYILVNIPAFELIAIKNGTPVFKSKIVTGKESDKNSHIQGYHAVRCFCSILEHPQKHHAKRGIA